MPIRVKLLCQLGDKPLPEPMMTIVVDSTWVTGLGIIQRIGQNSGPIHYPHSWIHIFFLSNSTFSSTPGICDVTLLNMQQGFTQLYLSEYIVHLEI